MAKKPKIEIVHNRTKNNRNIFLNILNLKNKNVVYPIVAILIVFIAMQGSNPAKNSESSELSRISEVSQPVVNKNDSTSVVDEVVESNVVADLAETANLAVAPNTANLSVSLSVLQDSAPQSAGVVEKPKILDVSSDKREITSYTTTQEETVQSIADKYGLTAQTIKWVNNIKGDKVEAGKEIKILPVDGILYSFKKDDNLEEVAKKYQASLERIISYNGLDEKDLKLKDGQQIVIPAGVLPEEERPDYVAPRRTAVSRTFTTNQSSTIVSSTPSSNYNAKAGNAYALGNCTWYVYNRRPDIGSFWGNATSWAVSARAAGYRVDSTPAVGAIAQWNAGAPGASGWGHVAYVESVNGDGTITVSDMNYGGGYNIVTTRTIQASSVSNYIH